MARVAWLVAMFAVCVAVGPAPAAERERGILDVLTDVLRGDRSVRGHVVAVDQGEVVIRGEDGRTYALSTVGLGADEIRRLKPGQAVTAGVKGTGEGRALVAESIQPASGPERSFNAVNGTVQSVSGSEVRFQTSDGLVIPLDLSAVVGARPQVQSGAPATLTYEQTSNNALLAVWIQPRTRDSAAASGGPAASPPTSGATGAYQRVHGYVQSIGIGTVSLKTDDGRTLEVDVNQVPESTRRSVRPGDVVSVVGRSAGEGRFTAELIQRDESRPAAPTSR